MKQNDKMAYDKSLFMPAIDLSVDIYLNFVQNEFVCK
jgi:hypothetical protein